MTLKELRISKGLTQIECAKYLGMTTRNYQNYENKQDLVGTAKYNSIYEQLANYGSTPQSNVSVNQFNTNVVIGAGLNRFYNRVKKYKKRDCFKQLLKFVKKDYDGKICILYGLRRTGKTTMLFQLLGELPINECAYIKAKVTDNMSTLTKDLNLLYYQGFKYILIDEITLLDDFINTSAVLSDVFSMKGMKIIVSGADSLGFAMANRDELYDRSITIHTSFISFKEYSKLLKLKSIDKYIEYCFTLKIENMSFDDPDSVFDDVSFRDDESTRKYIDTAISRNIQHTLKNDHYGEYFNELRELYEQGELTNVINRIVESMNHSFLLKVVQDKFKSHDLGSAKNLLLHDAPQDRAYVLYDVDTEQITKRLKKLIDVIEQEEAKINVSTEHIEKIKKYLIMLDLIDSCPNKLESGKMEEHYIFTQQGMRYAIAKALVYSLMQDEYFASISEIDKNYIIEKMLSDVKGRMMEDIVLLESKKALYKTKEVFKFKFDNGGEFDMVVYDKKTNSCQIYEVKHSDKIILNQTRFLMDEERCNIIERRYGTITDKYVIYRGASTISNGVKYLNVEEYLISLSWLNRFINYKKFIIVD